MRALGAGGGTGWREACAATTPAPNPLPQAVAETCDVQLAALRSMLVEREAQMEALNARIEPIELELALLMADRQG
jgi:hypothetical protein